MAKALRLIYFLLMLVGLVSGTLFLVLFVCLLWYSIVGGPLPWEAFWPHWLLYGAPLAILAYPKRVRRSIERKMDIIFWRLDKIEKAIHAFFG